MIASKKRDAALGIVGGIATGFTHSALGVEGAATLGFAVPALALYGWGAASLAQAKGYSAWWGLLALVTVVGLLVLVLLRDRHRDGETLDGWPGPHSREAWQPHGGAPTSWDAPST